MCRPKRECMSAAPSAHFLETSGLKTSSVSGVCEKTTTAKSFTDRNHLLALPRRGFTKFALL
jgi:hypothetical protein